MTAKRISSYSGFPTSVKDKAYQYEHTHKGIMNTYVHICKFHGEALYVFKNCNTCKNHSYYSNQAIIKNKGQTIFLLFY